VRRQTGTGSWSLAGAGNSSAANVGTNNLFAGASAGAANTSGVNNVGIATNALQSNTTGINNVCIAVNACGNLNGGSNNVGIGINALLANAGSGNTAIGLQAGTAVTGSNNTLLGYQAGISLSSGSNNTYIGYLAGNAMTTGSNNFILGTANHPTVSASNVLVIDGLIYGDRLTKTFGLGTTSPIAQFTIVGSSTQQSIPLVEVASSSGASFFRINSNGNVGIGSSSPVAPFTVSAGSSGGTKVVVDDGFISLRQTAGGSQKRFLQFANAPATAEYFSFDADTSGNPVMNMQGASSFTVQSGGNTPRFTVLSSGNVGIGTSTPAARLSVQSPAGSAADILTIASTSQTVLRINAAGNVGIGTAPAAQAGGGILSVASMRTQYFQDPTGGNAYFEFANGAGTTYLIERGITSQVGFQVRSNANQTGDIFQVASSSVTSYFNVSAQGRVGIGTTTPLSLLDIFGDIRVGTSSTSLLFANTATSKIGVRLLAPTSTVDINGSIGLKHSIFNINTTVDDSATIWVAASSSATTLTLPAISSTANRFIRVMNRGSATLTVARAGSDFIYYFGTSTTMTIDSGESYDFSNDGTYWLTE